MNVKARAEAVATFRHVHVFLMETLAAWVPGTPEMEAKVLFGRHMWRVAQLADALGRRTRELRAPLHHSRIPEANFMAALVELSKAVSTPARLEEFYFVALGAVEAAVKDYVEATDRLIDEPTVVIFDTAVREYGAMRAEAERLRLDFPILAPGVTPAESMLRRLFEASPRICDFAAGSSHERAGHEPARV